jgi:hypothetical protein
VVTGTGANREARTKKRLFLTWVKDFFKTKQHKSKNKRRKT